MTDVAAPMGWWNPTEQQQLAIDERARRIADAVLAEIDTTGLPTADQLARSIAAAAQEAAESALALAETRAIIDDGGASLSAVWSSQRIADELERVRGANGQPRFAGQGPPSDTIIGMEPGDVYLDVASGNLYRQD